MGASTVSKIGVRRADCYMTVHGAFLLFIGVAQVGWALAWLRWRTRPMVLSGLALSGGVLLLWILLYVGPCLQQRLGINGGGSRPLLHLHAATTASDRG